MKLLLFSDLHANVFQADVLVEMSAEVDVLVGAGDFGNVRKFIGDTLEVLRQVDKPAVLVPGNAESAEELAEAAEIWPTAEVLHGSGTAIGEIPFWGVGGGIPVTPFGSWSYDFTEEEARELYAGCPPGAVLVSHSPPKGLVDLGSSGLHLGSETLLETIRDKSPRLVVCGHIHYSWAQMAESGNTIVWNAGPDGIIVEI